VILLLFAALRSSRLINQSLDQSKIHRFLTSFISELFVHHFCSSNRSSLLSSFITFVHLIVPLTLRLRRRSSLVSFHLLVNLTLPISRLNETFPKLFAKLFIRGKSQLLARENTQLLAHESSQLLIHEYSKLFVHFRIQLFVIVFASEGESEVMELESKE